MNKLEYNIAEFASRWKKELYPASIQRGKDTGLFIAQDRKAGISKEAAKASQSKAIGVDKQWANESKSALQDTMNKPKLNRSFKNLRLKPDKRGNVKAPKSTNQLSSKSVQSFKQGAQNQATNAKNTRLRGAANQFKSNVDLRVGLDDALNPPKPFNANDSSWAKNANNRIKTEAPKVKVNSIPFKKQGLLSKIGGAIKRNPVAAGAGIGAVGAGIGYGIYKKMKSNNSRQK